MISELIVLKDNIRHVRPLGGRKRKLAGHSLTRDRCQSASDNKCLVSVRVGQALQPVRLHNVRYSTWSFRVRSWSTPRLIWTRLNPSGELPMRFPSTSTRLSSKKKGSTNSQNFAERANKLPRCKFQLNNRQFHFINPNWSIYFHSRCPPTGRPIAALFITIIINIFNLWKSTAHQVEFRFLSVIRDFYRLIKMSLKCRIKITKKNINKFLKLTLWQVKITIRF